MANKLCVLWRARRTEAWYQLSKQEVEDLLAKHMQNLKNVGGREIIACNSTWSSAEYEVFGIDEFPDLQARQAFIAANNEIGIFRYYDIEFTLGIQISPDNSVQ